MENKKNLPKKKFRAGSVSATVWENKGERDGKETTYPTVSLERNYKKDDEWNTTNSYRLSDIADAELVLRKAYEYLKLKEPEVKSNSSEEVIEEDIM